MDRCALGFLSALSALVLGSLIWFGVLYFLAAAGVDPLPGFGWVLGFTALMGLLGVLLQENLVVRLIVGLFRALSRLGAAD